MSQQSSDKTKAAYYMPLSSEYLKEGFNGSPFSSVFSTPKVNYSRETQDVISDLMREAKLSTTQRNGFESILRSGSQSSKETDQMRRREYLRKRFERGTALGLSMPSKSSSNIKSFYAGIGGGGRRSLDTIKGSGALDISPISTQTYTPVNKEREKMRFSYKMAHGVDPSPEILSKLINDTPLSKTRKSKQIGDSASESFDYKSDRFIKMRGDELVEEIRDRVEFLRSVQSVKGGQEHKKLIVSQLREKMRELSKMTPERGRDVIESLNLREIDPVFDE